MPTLKTPLDDPSDMDMSKDSKNVNNKEEVNTNNNDSTEFNSVMQENREFRERLTQASQLIVDLKKRLDNKEKDYQEQIDQQNRQIHNLQVSNDKLLTAKKDLQQQLEDEDARATRIAATDLIKQAIELKNNVIQKAHDEADSYRSQTVTEAEAQAHRIKNEADQYVSSAEQRAHNYNNQFVDIKRKLQDLCNSVQTSLDNSDVIPQNELTATKAQPVETHKAVQQTEEVPEQTKQETEKENQQVSKQFTNNDTNVPQEHETTVRKVQPTTEQRASLISNTNSATKPILLSPTSKLNAESKSNIKAMTDFDEIVNEINNDANTNNR